MQDESIGLLISDCARLIRRRFDARARALGVSRAQWQVLVSLRRLEGINQAGLADYLEVETITLCRMVDRLQEAGLVERRADPADRRAWKLYLTERASPLLDQLRAVADAITEEANAGLPEALRAAMAAGLGAVRSNLSGRDPLRQYPMPPTPAQAGATPPSKTDGPRLGRSGDEPRLERA